MLRERFSSLAVLPLLAWGLAACDPAGKEVAVARVGAELITAGDLRRLKADTPEALRSDKKGAEAAREYLQTLIDMELMLREARAKGLDQDPEFLQRWEEERCKKLVAQFQQRKIWEEIQLSEEELQERFAQSKWSRVLKLARIAVATEAEARQVVQQLEQGRPFAEVAREWSRDPQTAPQGGLLEPLYGRANMQELGVTPAIGEELFDLEVGAHSRPFRLGDYWVIFKLVDRVPAPLYYAEVFARETLKEEFYQRRKDLVAALVAEFGVEMDPQAISLLVARAAAGNGPLPRLAEGEKDRVLCRFRNGQFTLGNFLDAYRQIWFFHPVALDSSGVVQFTYQYLLPDVLLYRVALREGLEQDRAVASWLEAKEEAMLLEFLREREVERQIAVTPEAVRRYYETHPQRFMQPEELQVLEILAATQEEAAGLLGRIRAGEDMEALARRYSIRQGAQKNGGHFHLHPYERAVFGALLDTAMAARIGEVKGPVQVRGGYSVFKVVKKTPPQLQSFDQAVPRAIYWFKSQEEDRLFQDLLRRLREKYAGEVILFEDRLQAVEL